jgi:hypothetical protein
VRGIASSFITGIIIIAILFVMVRPGSKGPTLVTSVSNGLKGILGKATGGGTWAKG